MRSLQTWNLIAGGKLVDTSLAKLDHVSKLLVSSPQAMSPLVRGELLSCGKGNQFHHLY